jgi:2-polyprenyl-6-hydroxyphenyl methylase/3-demethylubiquinone-9 3-methyltransferase
MVDAALNADPAEIARFQAAASRWWDPEGEMRPLHDLNPVRLRYVERTAPLVGRTVVDVGCGGGLLAEAMARQGARVVGLDLASDLLRVAQLHALDAGITLDYRLESAEQHAAGHAGQYDVVTCMEMLEHVPDPALTVQACATLARPGGWVFFSTLNRNPKSFVLAIVGTEYVLNLLPKGTHEYAKFIKPSELTRYARAASLALHEMVGLNYNPLSKKATLGPDTDVNYMMAFRKPGPP